MPWIDAMAPAIAEQAAQIRVETWGHLAPGKKRTYQGWMVWTHSAYGDLLLIDSEWDGLKDSPWLFTAMQGFWEQRETEPGTVYRFDGTFRNYKFKGSVKQISTE
jgi:hypothetical protein